jgi:hypothetical protein
MRVSESSKGERRGSLPGALSERRDQTFILKKDSVTVRFDEPCQKERVLSFSNRHSFKVLEALPRSID